MALIDSIEALLAQRGVKVLPLNDLRSQTAHDSVMAIVEDGGRTPSPLPGLEIVTVTFVFNAGKANAQSRIVKERNEFIDDPRSIPVFAEPRVERCRRIEGLLSNAVQASTVTVIEK